MESSARGNISNTWSVRMASFESLNLDKLVNALERGLTEVFVDVKVRWVDCPDLSQEPFNLAAPGLCGQPAFIEIGDMSFLQSYPCFRPIFPIKEIIKFLNRDCRNSFIFGNGVNENYEPLILNSSFSPKTNGLKEIENRSRKVSFNTCTIGARKCNLKVIPDYDFNCSRLGTLFLCDGLKGSVLEVRVKKYRWPANPSLPGFIDSIRFELMKEFGIKKPVVLGGVYVVNNALWRHELIRHPWEHRSTAGRSILCEIKVPETIISTFNSTAGYLPHSGYSPIKLTCKSTHSLSHHNGIGPHYFHEATNYGIEYLGYFCPAEMVYCFDEPRIDYSNLPKIDYSNLP